VDAIEILKDAEEENQKKWAVCDETLCLGCGVCYSACKFGGILMKPRAQRVFIPETCFDQIVVMAIERGKLANLLFEDPDRLSHRALRRIVNILEKSPPFKAAMAIKPLKSVFLSTVVKAAMMRSGEKVFLFFQIKLLHLQRTISQPRPSYNNQTIPIP